jgi:alpha-glucosidase
MFYMEQEFSWPKRMVAELAEDGFKTVVIWSGIKIDKEYSVYKEALKIIL